MKTASRFFVAGFLSVMLMSVGVPVHADEAYCQKVGNKTDLTIREVRNRFNGVNQPLPSAIMMQEGLAFEVIVKTNECTGTSGTEVEIRENNTLVKRIAIPGIGPGGSGSNKTLVTWTPFVAGTRTLTFKVDPNNTIPEVSESNNTYKKSISVSPAGSRDVRFHYIGSNDLINPVAGRVLQFEGDITIINNQKKTGSMTIGWYVDGKLIKIQGVDLSTISDTTVRSTFDWVAIKGTHTVSVKSDIYNTVAEASEANNSGELKFTVGASSQSELLAIAQVEARDITSKSARVFWRSGTGSMGEYRYGLTQAELPSKQWTNAGVIDGVDTGNIYGSSVMLSGLTPQTKYYVEVRKWLGATDNTTKTYGATKVMTFTTKASSAHQSDPLTTSMLVKNKKFAEVFSVDEDTCLRWIPNEVAAAHYFGADWEKKITLYDELPADSVFCESLAVPEVAEPSHDSDGDGLSDADELQMYKTDPSNIDTDGDGYDDGQEIRNGYDPNGSGRLANS